MQDRFFQSLMVEPPVICGRKLLPFSIAHEYILKSVESPYLVGGTVDRGSILQAIDICSRSWEENRTMMGIGYIPQIKTWRKWSRKWRRFDYAAAHKSFTAYLKNFTESPAHWTSDEAGEGIKAPTEFHLAYILMRYMRFSESQAWNCSVNRARSYYSTHSETNGDRTLVSEFEQKTIEGINSDGK